MKKTDAFQKVDTARDKKHAGATKIQAKDLSSTVYLNAINGKPCATLYRGRAVKATGYYSYPSEERRAKHVAEWMASQAERKQSRSTATRELAAGDVLRASWGYDQTNIDYYLVQRLIGTSSVEIVEIASIKNYDDNLTGKCIPDPSKVIGEPMRKRANGKTVRINSHTWASKLEPIVLAGNVTVFPADSWTAYH